MGEHGAVQRGKKKTSGAAGEVAVQTPKPLALGEASGRAMSSHLRWKRARLMGSGALLPYKPSQLACWLLRLSSPSSTG